MHPRDIPDYTMHTLVMKFNDNSGYSIEMTADEAGVVGRWLKEKFGAGRMLDFVWNAEDDDPKECRESGRHGEMREPDGTCTYCSDPV